MSTEIDLLKSIEKLLKKIVNILLKPYQSSEEKSLPKEESVT